MDILTCHFLGKYFFFSLSKFHYTCTTLFSFFINHSIELFSETKNELNHYSPSSTLILDESAKLSIDVEPTIAPPLCRSTLVRQILHHLNDYHCFSTIVNLHEPQTCCKASIDLLQQQVRHEKLQALEKNHTWEMVDLH